MGRQKQVITYFPWTRGRRLRLSPALSEPGFSALSCLLGVPSTISSGTAQSRTPLSSSHRPAPAPPRTPYSGCRSPPALSPPCSRSGRSAYRTPPRHLLSTPPPLLCSHIQSLCGGLCILSLRHIRTEKAAWKTRPLRKLSFLNFLQSDITYRTHSSLTACPSA